MACLAHLLWALLHLALLSHRLPAVDDLIARWVGSSGMRLGKALLHGTLVGRGSANLIIDNWEWLNWLAAKFIGGQ